MELVYFEAIGLLEIIMLTIVYFSKKRIKSEENRIYQNIILTNLSTQILHMLSFFSISNINRFPISNYIITHLYLVSLVGWLLLNVSYIFVISLQNKVKKVNIQKIVKTFYIVLMAIFSLLIMLLPVYSNNDATGIYTYGFGVEFVYILTAIFVSISVFVLAFNFQKSNLKKYIPIIIFIMIATITAFIQKNNPELLLITNIETFITILMYFTIENPDVQMLEQLSIAKEAADNANHAKSDFLSNMSHEIRTPLNAIVGFSESLKEDDIPDTAKEKVNDIITASNNLLEIVNGILDISKIEANKLEIINKEYDIKSMLDELVSLTKSRIGDKGLEFRVNIDSSIPRVLYGDNVRLKQIILNILTNAVKYTKEGFIEFTVSTVVKDNVCRLIVSVEDSGIGIKEESLPKLFTKFERLNVEKQLTIEGTGLGLAITKKLVDLMNGKIIVQSVYGKGSKFTISIDQRIIAVEPESTKQTAVSESKIVDANGARILIVDDNELNIKVASVLLKKYHFNIDSCTSGLACLLKIKNDEKYSIIFLDDMMPKMSGRETIKKLKEYPNFDTPVIALTANAITGMKQEYLECGFDDYLSKPIEKLELERVIKKYVNRFNSTEANSNMFKSTKSIFEKELTIELPILSKEKEPIVNNKLYSNKKILLVDDNELNIKVAENFLKKYDLDITSVNSGSSAIEKVIENEYDLILLDDMMPELDGCKTLKNLKTLDNFTTPVVMMTASSKDEVIDKINQYGFSDYLGKPINKEELAEVLDKSLNK